MAVSEQQLKRIQEKLQELVKKQAVLAKTNKALQEELEREKKQNAAYSDRLEELKRQVEILKISTGTWNDKDKQAFEKRINQYIKDIDKCITLMSD